LDRGKPVRCFGIARNCDSDGSVNQTRDRAAVHYPLQLQEIISHLNSQPRETHSQQIDLESHHSRKGIGLQQSVLYPLFSLGRDLPITLQLSLSSLWLICLAVRISRRELVRVADACLGTTDRWSNRSTHAGQKQHPRFRASISANPVQPDGPCRWIFLL